MLDSFLQSPVPQVRQVNPGLRFHLPVWLNSTVNVTRLKTKHVSRHRPLHRISRSFRKIFSTSRRFILDISSVRGLFLPSECIFL